MVGTITHLLLSSPRGRRRRRRRPRVVVAVVIVRARDGRTGNDDRRGSAALVVILSPTHARWNFFVVSRKILMKYNNIIIGEQIFWSSQRSNLAQ